MAGAGWRVGTAGLLGFAVPSSAAICHQNNML